MVSEDFTINFVH